MRTFAIQSGKHKGKHIEVTKYVRTARGVQIRIVHDVPAAAGKELRWVQTITENGSFFKACGLRNYVDPFGPSGTAELPGFGKVCKADDNKPFYWTDTEFSGGQGPFFSDAPTEDPPAKGRTWIQFVTALTEVTGTDVVHLVAISWGFDRLANGSVKVAAIVTPTEEQMKIHGKTLKNMYPAYTFR
ncbi:MAG TPA: hypothetical protein VMH81_07870 [Bryobacteraceae bacterium]|nr:hypothetical protein [Bryobacteraceae bacterium]